MAEHPPGPPPIPRCPECNAFPDIRRGQVHTEDCERGKEQHADLLDRLAVDD